MSNIRRSREIKNEPTMTGTMQKQYARKIKKQFRKFVAHSKDAFLQMVTQSELEAGYIELVADIDIPRYAGIVDELAVAVVINPISDIVDATVTQAYMKGRVFADMAGSTETGAVFPVTIGQLGAADWRTIDALKIRNLSVLKKLSADTSDRIVRVVSDGIATGKGPAVIAKLLTREVAVLTDYRALLIARTETITAFNQGAEQRYSQYGYNGFEWLAASGCCDKCNTLNGQTFRFDSGAERPPLHPACRCTILPVNI